MITTTLEFLAAYSLDTGVCSFGGITRGIPRIYLDVASSRKAANRRATTEVLKSLLTGVRYYRVQENCRLWSNGHSL
jgi:hypothetical protein